MRDGCGGAGAPKVRGSEFWMRGAAGVSVTRGATEMGALAGNVRVVGATVCDPPGLTRP